jgi:diguanylate cyclase
MLATLLTIAPTIAVVMFAVAWAIGGVAGPTLETSLASGSAALIGFWLFIKKPLVSDNQIALIAIGTTITIGALVLRSPGVIWLAVFPLLFSAELTVIHLFLPRRTAVTIHVGVAIVAIATMQIANPGVGELLTRDLSAAAWTGVIGIVVSLIRRHFDTSTALLYANANVDPLTNLTNRFAFSNVVNDAIATVDDRNRKRDAAATVFLLDLDRFKDINDALGHAFGDVLLQRVAGRLNSFVQQTALVSGAVAARLGGDEFALLVPRTLSVDEQIDIAESLRVHIVDRLLVDEINVTINVAIGSASFPDDGRTLSTLLHYADAEMYRRKMAHTGVAAPEAPNTQPTARRTRLLRDLEKAIAANELMLYFQPKIRLSDCAPLGFEALLRWQHPELGFVPPDEFIALAEGTGLIGPLTTNVLKMAAKQTAAWERMGLDLNVAVNISTRSLVDRNFAKEVAAIYREADASLRGLTLEVTETAVMRDVRLAEEILKEIRALGIRLSIDDFGTGYCSLAYLRDLNVDELKIDRSFILGMETDANTVIVRTAIQLAHNLGLSVVAEGVENQSIIEALRELGCDSAQGYHIARPLPAQEATVWITERLGASAELVRTLA